MNDLLRPALYDAWHAVEPVRPRDAPRAPLADRRAGVRERRFPRARPRCSRLPPATCSRCARAGAYGFAMSSNYNSRPRACEVIVDGDRMHLVRPREDAAELFARESDAAVIAFRARASARLADVVFSMCESATIAHATRGIGGEILQFNKMWLEFRQQVAMGLSRGCSAIDDFDSPSAACDEVEAP